MTTATTSSPCSQATNAAFQAWVGEVVTALFTTIGLTQTADTGQINPATVAAPGAVNTMQGYVIGRFNDTLQSTAPLFFKLEFGSGSASATNPQMYITIGTGSNGSGTLTGTLSTRVCVNLTNVTGNSGTSFTSRFCYNATLGVFWFVFKIGIVTNSAAGCLVIGRSNNSSGVTTADGAYVLTSGSATTTSNPGGIIQCVSFNTSAVYPTTISNGANWGGLPFNTATTTYLTNVSVIPGWVMWPFFQLSMHLAVGVLTEIAAGSTFSLAMIGSTALTYISTGSPFGGNSSLGYNSSSPLGTLCLPWQ